MISVKVSEGRSAVEALAGEWDALVGDAFTAAFAQSAWYLAWLDAFEPSNIAVITARQDGRLVGLLPMARARTDARGLYFTQISQIARGNYEAPIVEPALASTVLPAMLDAAVSHFGRRGAFWWPNVPSADPSAALFRDWFASRNMPYVEEVEVAPRLRLHGRNFDEIEKEWTSSHRKDVRRQRKRLGSEKGPVSLWVPSSLEEAEPVLTEFFRVHDEKWVSQGFPGIFTPAMQRHFRAILRRLWSKSLHFSTVRCGETHVSYLVGFFAGGWLQYYRPSYRPEFGVYSPSKIHVGLLVEEACRRQWMGIDFLLGGYPYKHSWANETIQVTSFLAGFHKWAPSYVWFTRGKPWAKKRFTGAYNETKMWLQKTLFRTPKHPG
jgi:CelD/BcsL family acetyltransferase involved in cellulose biosynthesis